jgi:phosphoglycerate kinase
LGYVENPAFASSTRAVAETIARASLAFTVAVGDDTTKVARELEAQGRTFGHVSSGGEAATALIEGKKLPGLEALRR